VLIDTEGAINARKKFVRLLYVLVPAALAMLGQQVQSAIDFLKPIAHQSAKNYYPTNLTGPFIDSYNLYAVIDDRDLVVARDMEYGYGFSWHFASLLRIVYVPIFIFAAYPTSTKANPKTNSRPSTNNPENSSIVDESAKKSFGKANGKEGLLDGAVELAIAVVPLSPRNVPSVVIPDNDQPIGTPRPVNGSPRLTAHSPRKSTSPRGSGQNTEYMPLDSAHDQPRRSQHLETPHELDYVAERRSSEHDATRKSSPGRKMSSPKKPKSAHSSPSTHTRSLEPSPRKTASPSHLRHVLPSPHTQYAVLDEADEDEPDVVSVPNPEVRPDEAKEGVRGDVENIE